MYNKENSEVIDSSLYDKLLNIASGKKEKRLNLKEEKLERKNHHLIEN